MCWQVPTRAGTARRRSQDRAVRRGKGKGGTLLEASPTANDNRMIAGTLHMRGLCLARVSKPDVAANERALSGYRQYITDHPEEARRYGIRQPNELAEGQLVLVAVEDHQPTVYLFNQVLTATERGELREYIRSLNSAGLPDIASAVAELQTVSEAAAATDTDIAESGLSAGALAKRWGYSRQGVQKLARRPDFPAPRFIFNRGKVRIWAVEDIEAYERDRPELHSEAAKFLKVRGFARALRKGAQQPTG